MSGLRQLIRTAMTAVLPRDRWLVHGPRDHSGRPQVALTFDDGPHPEHTVAVLNALAEWQLRGTFFVVGQCAEQCPQLIERILREGHALANHTWSHREPREIPAADFLSEVNQTRDWLTQQFACSPEWVRPPKGELTLAKFRGLWKQRHPIALWNVDPRDYRMAGPADVDCWCSSYRARQGDIVLMHDRLPWAAAIIHKLGHLGLWTDVETVLLDDFCSRPADRHRCQSVNQCPTPNTMNSVSPAAS